MNRFVVVLVMVSPWLAADEARELVQLPQMMQEHMLSNMRDHLRALDQILRHLSEGRLDDAADIAEYRLGMSSLDVHGARQMAPFMPEGMKAVGTEMHRAASRFSLKAQEAELLPAYKAVNEITAACVACHAAYRIR